MIWAAAFVDAYNRGMQDAVRLDPTGTFVRSERAAAFVPALAVQEAARLVRIARDTLPKLAAADVKLSHEEFHRETVDMLRDMLGVDANGAPYR